MLQGTTTSEMRTSRQPTALKPVSYTHLDVYKRQVQERAKCRLCLEAPARGHLNQFHATVLPTRLQIKQEALDRVCAHLPIKQRLKCADGQGLTAAYPVSYTHLDVYKRQASVRPRCNA